MADTGGRGLIERLTLRASCRPTRWLMAASLLLVSCWTLASRLQIRGDFIELLPSSSAAAQRYRAAVERMASGGSSLIVLARSPDPQQNQRFISGLEAELAALPPTQLASVEHGPGRLRDYFSQNRWWFLDLSDLERLNCELEAATARALPGYVELEDPCTELGSSALRAKLEKSKQEHGDISDAFRSYAELRANQQDRFPTGYYSSATGDTYVLLLRSAKSGLGDNVGAGLLTAVQDAAYSVAARTTATDLEIGFAGDIPNAIAERRALEEDLGVVSASAVTLILLCIFGFFALSRERTPEAGRQRLRFEWRRGLGALVCIGLVVSVGCGVAFAVAQLAFGHLNAATTFLGSIIVGNGINYGIVYLARYRDMRLVGCHVETALVDAARVCRRGTWIASLAAGGAYAALMITSFKGFSEFGLIGAVGMVSCWLATFAFCPAVVAWSEQRALFGRWPQATLVCREVPVLFRRTQVRLGSRLPDSSDPTSHGPFRLACHERLKSTLVLSITVTSLAAAALALPPYFNDPWEYDFSKLSSRVNKTEGAGQWSKVVDRILGSRGAPQLVLADEPREVPGMVARLENSADAPRLVQKIETLTTFLGGDERELRKKERLLTKLRRHVDRLTSMDTANQSQTLAELRPPDILRPPKLSDLPENLLHRFRERGGTTGTQIYVHLNPSVSQSRGRQLLEIDRYLDHATLTNGTPAPVAARAVVFGEMIRSMRRDGPNAVALAAGIVLLALAAGIRHYRSVAAVVVSLLCGLLWTLGFAAWSDTKLNFLNFVAIPLTIGIGAEYAINLHDRIVAERGSIAAGLRSAGGSVLLCSITTVIGYAALLFADNRALQSFGAYAIAGEVACLIAAFFVLPALLAVLRPRSMRAPQRDVVMR